MTGAPTVAAPPSDRPGPAPATTRPRPWREAGLVLLTLLAYFGLRLLVEGDRATAVANAERLIGLEATLGIDVEQAVQAHVVDHELLRWTSSNAYVWFHWPLLVVVMGVLTFRAPEVQARLRRTLGASAAIGVALFALLPTAPPRFLPGFVGTVSDAARRHYLPYPLEWTNAYAAVPSYHVGWTLVACLAIASVVGDRRLRALVLAPAPIVAVAVVATGNHYVLDATLGAVLALVSWRLVARPRPASDPATVSDGAPTHPATGWAILHRWQRRTPPPAASPAATAWRSDERSPPHRQRSSTSSATLGVTWRSTHRGC